MNGLVAEPADRLAVFSVMEKIGIEHFLVEFGRKRGPQADKIADHLLNLSVIEFSETITDTNSELTLEGLRMVYEANRDES